MKKGLLFVYPHPATFINLDIKILSEDFEVETNTYNWRNKNLTPLFLIKQFFYLLFNTYRFQVIVVSFGGYWSFLPALFGKIFGKKTFIILHGTDCAAFEEINYGSLRKQPLRQFCKWSYSLAYMLLPVSESLIYTENNYFEKEKIIKQGYRYFFPSLNTPAKVIPNGFEIEKWQFKGEDKPKRQEKSFITVVSEKSQFKRKGLDLILELSKKMLDCSFYIAGMDDHHKEYADFKNVFFLGRMPQKELKKKFHATEYYLQLSVFEGFGCALCEAMLCGCIPIGSEVNAIPSIIGKSGYILPYKSSDELLKMFEHKILPNKKKLSSLAIEKIKNNYAIEKRADMLKRTILES